jgi:hypothetical protein
VWYGPVVPVGRCLLTSNGWNAFTTRCRVIVEIWYAWNCHGAGARLSIGLLTLGAPGFGAETAKTQTCIRWLLSSIPLRGVLDGQVRARTNFFWRRPVSA